MFEPSQTQSGAPLHNEDHKEAIEPIQAEAKEEIQESGCIDVEGSQDQVDLEDLVSQVPRMRRYGMEKVPTPDMIGAIKVKDALFIGDELSSQDLEFVVTNKVSHIVNCAGREIPNHWEPVGIEYLTFYWVDQDNQVLFDPEDNITNEIINFIDEALENGESCLVHSIRGQSRASVALSAYFMQKYRWSLYKTLEFLNSRRPNLEIRAAFVSQLAEFEQKLITQERGPETANWNEVANKEVTLGQDIFYEDDELILRNTYLNAQLGYNKSPENSNSEQQPTQKEISNQSKIRWIDNNSNNKDKLRTNNSEDDLLCLEEIHAVVTHKTSKHQKSIIKPWKGSGLDAGSKSVCQPSQPVEKALQQESAPKTHFKSMKNKREPLISSPSKDEPEEEKSSLQASKTQIVNEIKKENKLIEQFYGNKDKKKFFSPKKEQKFNNSEPIDLKKKIFTAETSANPQPSKKKINGKAKKDGSVAQDDSQNTSQKDVIIRKIKKKGDNAKTVYSQNLPFGHHKSNSEL